MKSLIDTGATGYLFIDVKLAYQLQRRLGAKIENTIDEGNVAGYDGGEQKINQVLTISLNLAGRSYPQQQFIVLAMSRDIIVGKQFMADHNLLADCNNHTLIRREDITINAMEPDYVAAKQIMIPKKNLFKQKYRSTTSRTSREETLFSSCKTRSSSWASC